MLRTKFHVEAKQDFQESLNWYREQSLEAAVRFAKAVEDAVNRVASDPERFPQYDERCRTCSLSRFPFEIIYLVNENVILVMAVSHCKRQRNYWRDRRLEEPSE